MKKIIMAISIVALLIIVTVTATALTFAEEKLSVNGQEKMISIAHRGASAYAPENTMAAFAKGVEMGADYIEIDVQMSKDGIPIIIHDDSLDRTTNGTGNINDYTLEELKSLNAGSWFGKEFSGETIPTFDEVLEEFGGKVSILIELKYPEIYPGIEEKVAKALKEHKLIENNSDKIIIQSFNHASVQKSKQLLPEILHGVLVGKDWGEVSDKQLEEFSEYADYFNPNFNIVTAELVERVHLADMIIYPYTVKHESEAANFG
ncbi:Glycerophosphoryl diester phosphodiesterase OS=Ureibacillus acetophenoni OX=614649 GN=SAMN05877842_105182 PE=4 SV=1 [Ureibacillus acetophenoni]